jgi:hypothetical protein
MAKYDRLKSLKKTKARVPHLCSRCGAAILPGDHYYKEHIDDRFLQSLHGKKFCGHCFDEHGDALLKKA